MNDTGSSAHLLGEDGPFASALPGFAPRQAQIEMAQVVERTLSSGESLVAEAGTGIGKTLAYLVPALLSGERIIVSTGTKTLQDQLFFRDLPLVKEALGLSVRPALLKGRSNYLCLHRMQMARTDGRLPSREAVTELEGVLDWSARTVDGAVSPVRMGTHARMCASSRSNTPCGRSVRQLWNARSDVPGVKPAGISVGCVSARSTIRSAAAQGRGAYHAPFTMVAAAVTSPEPRERESTETTMRVGCRRSPRRLERTSRARPARSSESVPRTAAKAQGRPRATTWAAYQRSAAILPRCAWR